ncbi:hypothetical protein [Actinoallomurus spadix]|uniref:Uncharacterized protein n=1 Tax=Actinoallomurus spadix TaxID=79912 RepID=A0ABN0WXN9_9ACTN|nr:hypothetical protein [Actinoallomurus spadix]
MEYREAVQVRQRKGSVLGRAEIRDEIAGVADQPPMDYHALLPEP